MGSIGSATFVVGGVTEVALVTALAIGAGRGACAVASTGAAEIVELAEGTENEDVGVDGEGRADGAALAEGETVRSGEAAGASGVGVASHPGSTTVEAIASSRARRAEVRMSEDYQKALGRDEGVYGLLPPPAEV